MHLIRCTKKLLNEMGLKSSDLHEAEGSTSGLESWHANLLYIDRRKCVLFVNDKTLFNFLVPDVSRAEIRKLDELFRSAFASVMEREKLTGDVKGTIASEYKDVRFAKTDNRSVLGSMNDLAFHYEIHIGDEGGLHRCDLPRIIRRLNRMPMSAIGFEFPINRLRAMYGCAA